ncbi:hypothetical protein ASZ90_008603 [hydrocarbon metagenome]|uniref:Uncharacterized protein n=1 Tax=hydrocarbon metagenome TaxID=938273 RepID=A0A0W8FL50_9ZZZZ
MLSHKKIIIFFICSLFIAAVVAYKDYGEYSNLRFVVDAESSQRGCSQIFFDTGNGYNEQESYSVFVEDGGFQQHVYPLPAKEIKSIRFDPINVSAVVKVKNFRIEDQQGRIIKTFLPQDFKRIQQINKVKINDGILTIYVDKNANDPILVIKKSSIKNQINCLSYVKERGWIITGYALICFLILIALNYLLLFAILKQYIISIACFLSILLSFAVIARWCYYIDAYSVNIFFWDQWDFYVSLFEKKNLWELFRWQHGPHRMGAGFIFAKIIAECSGWNTRVEAFAIGGIVCLAMLTAIFLRNKLGPRLNWADAAIPLIFLTPMQYEIFAGTPIPSHGAVPLLLLVMYCLVWVVCRGLVRYATILTLNFFLIYTGYGIFIGIITPFIFGMEALHAHGLHDRKGLWLALTGVAISLISAGSVFMGYQFSPGIAGFQFPIPEWWRYPQFMSLMLANFCGIKSVTPLSYITGFLILFLMSALALINMVRFLRSGVAVNEASVAVVVAILTTFTLIFCATTAIGRIQLGMPSAQSSRYITNIIPGFLGIYLWIISLPPGVLRRILLAAIVAGLIAASFPLRAADLNTLKWYMEGKTKWKTVYLNTEDIEMATRAANFSIYPVPENTFLKQKLEYLKKEKLNLYLDVPSSAAIRPSGAAD